MHQRALTSPPPQLGAEKESEEPRRLASPTKGRGLPAKHGAHHPNPRRLCFACYL
ncbi:hypothetical protein BJV74DRAFT_864660 [Russula compacta]|nr:hypothetical protein BJV74DRAFT_864660 [Russula compacta]